MMNSFFDLFTHPWAQTLGWTLIHSVWQAFAIWIILSLVNKLFPQRLSNTRYVFTMIAMLLIPFASLATYFVISTSGGASPDLSGVAMPGILKPGATPVESSSGSMLNSLGFYVQHGIPYVLPAWLLGMLLFSMRVATGWWFTQALKKYAEPVEPAWQSRLEELAVHFGITRSIGLVTSSIAKVPLVVGHLRPFILFPIGMFTGLTTEQIESVIVHELVHIRRHDYLVNVLQVILESIFFFNPFVWLLSAQVRREREFCCDDAVIEFNPNALGYAQTLVMLEESRSAGYGAAVSLAGSKNELFNRIKRIMGTSIKTYTGGERLIPVALVAIGLVCASWLSGDRQPEYVQNPAGKELTSTAVALDTPIDNSVSKKIIVRVDSSDEEKEISMNLDIDLDTMEVPLDQSMNKNIRINIQLDTLINLNTQIDPNITIDLNGQYNQALEQLKKATDALAKSLDAASEVNRDELRHQVDDMRQQIEAATKSMDMAMANVDMKNLNIQISRQLEAQTRDLQSQMDMQRQMMEAQQLKSARDSMLMQRNYAMEQEQMKQAERQVQEAARQRELEIREQFRSMREQQLRQQRLGDDAGKNQITIFPQVRDAMVEDGYLKDNEKITNLTWDVNDNKGTVDITVNGKQVKNRDAKKYEALRKKIANEDNK